MTAKKISYEDMVGVHYQSGKFVPVSWNFQSGALRFNGEILVIGMAEYAPLMVLADFSSSDRGVYVGYTYRQRFREFTCQDSFNSSAWPLNQELYPRWEKCDLSNKEKRKIQSDHILEVCRYCDDLLLNADVITDELRAQICEILKRGTLLPETEKIDSIIEHA